MKKIGIRDQLSKVNATVWLAILLLGIISIALLVNKSLQVHFDDQLRVVFMNVGQGDAIFIESQSGEQVLVDGGANRRVLNELSEVMWPWDRSLDYVIATHPDADHIGGLIDVIERYEIKNIIDSGLESDTTAYKRYLEALNQSSAKKYDSSEVSRIQLGDSVLELFPTINNEPDDLNDQSIISKLSFGELEFLLTGDASKKVEQELVNRYGERVEAEVLKLGHHGSRTSTDPNFLAAVNPDYVIISAAEDSRYGHPHDEVLETLFQYGRAYILHTHHDDRIDFRITNTGDLVLKQ